MMELVLLWIILGVAVTCVTLIFFRGANGKHDQLWKDQALFNDAINNSLDKLEAK